MRKSTIIFGNNSVTKTSTPELMRVEVEKSLRAYEIGKNCGLFRVPRVLEYDNIKGSAVFERIHDVNPIANTLKNTKQNSSIFEQAGIALAIIHREFKLPKDFTVELPIELRLPGTEVYIHGDFNGINVCSVPSTPSIVILDWQMTDAHGEEATYGSRYFDLVWFINYFIMNPTLKNPFHDPTNKIMMIFLKSYFKEANLIYDSGSFFHYCMSFFTLKLTDQKEYPFRKKKLLIPYYNLLMKKFLKSL